MVGDARTRAARVRGRPAGQIGTAMTVPPASRDLAAARSRTIGSSPRVAGSSIAEGAYVETLSLSLPAGAAALHDDEYWMFAGATADIDRVPLGKRKAAVQY